MTTIRVHLNRGPYHDRCMVVPNPECFLVRQVEWFDFGAFDDSASPVLPVRMGRYIMRRDALGKPTLNAPLRAVELDWQGWDRD